MKQNYFRHILLCLCLLAGTTTALAATIQIDGIYYSISSGVASASSGRYATGEVTIPDSVTCEGVTYPVTSISDRAFYLNTGMTSIAISANVEYIGTLSFSSCRNLASVTFGENAKLKTIGMRAFYGSAISSITLPGRLETIQASAFASCSNLTSVYIPVLVRDIDSNPFTGCSNLNSIEVAEGNYNFDSREGCNAIISKSSRKLLAGCKNTVIPDGIYSIGNYAFQGCSGLTSIEIPNSLTTIGEGAFQGCHGLTSVAIPNRVTSIGRYAFEECSSLTSVSIPESVTSIGVSAFIRCSSLTSIAIPGSVTSIGGSAFSGCTNLSKVTIASNAVVSGTEYQKSMIELFGDQVKEYVLEEGITAIGNHAFHASSGKGSENITSLTIPEGVVSIGEGAFIQCSGLTSLVLPNSLTTIARGAFQRCTGLTSIVLPEGLTSIGSSVFSGCSNLTSITIPDGLTDIEYGAFGDAWLNNQPDGVVYAGKMVYAFKGDERDVVIRDGTLGIVERAFEHCRGLTSITIPNSLTMIGEGAFYGCI